MKPIAPSSKGQILEGIAKQFGLVPLDDTTVAPPSYVGGQVLVSGVFKTVVAESVLVGGVWKTVTLKQVCIGGAWKTLVDGGGPPPADVTPNAVNWIGGSTSGSAINTNDPQITGIDTVINLEVSWSITSGLPDLDYRINLGAFNVMLTNPYTFAVSNNQFVGFQLRAGGGPSSADFTVRNASDGNVILDTFSLTATDS
jgi:hypothetical protein